MTLEERELVLKDLCARLPYGVICDMWFEGNESDKITEVLKCGGLMRLMNSEFNFIVKPYLRPMSSMTEEELKELQKNSDSDYRDAYDIRANSDNRVEIIQADCLAHIKDIDWLNVNHFDYRGLIPIGLALEAPEDMYSHAD